MSMGSPWFRSPLTDFTGNLISHQYKSPCQAMELDLVECMEAHGLLRVNEKCSGLLRDFKECASRTKQTARVKEMWFERQRQIYSGERSKKDRYAEAPPYGSF